MLQDEEELDYDEIDLDDDDEISIENEDRLLESSEQESEKSTSDDESPPRNLQSPEASEFGDSSPNNVRGKMTYLKCRKTYANSSRSYYRYSEPHTRLSNIADDSYEGDELDESNLCPTSIDSGVSDPEVSQFTYYEQAQNGYSWADEDHPESPTKHLIYNNKKDFSDHNDTVLSPNDITNPIATKDLLEKNNHKVAIHSPQNLQTPIKSKKKSPHNFATNFTRKLIFPDNTMASHNATKDSTKGVPTTNIFHGKNYIQQSVLKIIETNVAIQSSKNMGEPIKSKQNCTNFTRKSPLPINTVTSPNGTTDLTGAAITTNIFHGQNDIQQSVPKIIGTNVVIQSSKNMGKPIKSKQKCTNFTTKFTLPINTVTSPNGTSDSTGAGLKTNIFDGQNNTHQSLPKMIEISLDSQSSKNVKLPIKSKQKSTNFTRKFTNSNNTTVKSPTDPTEPVPTAKIFHDQNIQNNTYHEVENMSRNNAQSINVQTPNKIALVSELTTIKIPGKSNAMVFQPMKKVQPNASKNKSIFLKENTLSASDSDGCKNSFVDDMAIQSPKNADVPITSFDFNRKISPSGTKKTSTETMQSPKMVSENLQGPIKPTFKPTNLKIQINGEKRIFVSGPQTLDLSQSSQRITETKPFTLKRTFEKPTVLSNGQDISRFRTCCTAEEAKETCLKINDTFKVPLKMPPFKPDWKKSVAQSSASMEVPEDNNTKEDIDTMDLATLVMKSSIASDGDDVGDGSFLDEDLSIYEDGSSIYGDCTSIYGDGTTFYEDNSNTLQRVNEWVGKQEGRIEVRTIPSVFKNLCYNRFIFNRMCQNRCKNEHCLRIHFSTQRVSNLTKQEFKAALNFAIRIPSFYEEILPIFAEILGFKDDKEGLIYLVHHIFKNNSPINQVEALKTVLTSLQQTDLETLKESVEYLLMQVGFKSYTTFGAALVEIIIASDDVPSYWPIMRRMITGGLTLSGRLATTFLTILVKPPVDSNICREAYTLILKYKFLILAAIKNEIRDQFLLLAKPKIRTSYVAFEESTRNNSVSSSYSAFPQHVPKLNRPSTFDNSSTRYQNSLGISENVLGSNSNVNIDFASLSKNEQLLPGASHFNAEDKNYGLEQHGFDYRGPSKRPNQSKINIDGRQSNFYSSDDSPHSREDIHTIPSGHKFPNRSGLTYNPEGFEYDPAGDYSDKFSKTKRKHQEFDRQLNNDSQPPQKKFQLNPARLTAGLQNNNIFDAEIDESFTGIPAARSRQDLEYSKPPKEPEFGKLCLNPDYSLDASLHNLYVQSIGSETINEIDVSLLSEAFVLGKGHEFLRLIKKYQGPPTVKNFITQSLSHLTKFKRTMLKTWMRVLDSMARAMPNFYSCEKIRAIIEVITMNLLFVQVAYKLWTDAKDLLMKFSDWDSLVTSRVSVLTIDTEAGVSILGRYLFIAKLLQLTEPKFCFKILTCPEFKLMENQSKWPYYEKEPNNSQMLTRDLKNRNSLLTILLRESYLHDIGVVTDIYKMALSRNSGIWNFNMIPFINPMIEKLLAEKKIEALEHIYRKSNVLFKYIDISIMRQFLIVMFSHLPASDGFKIFDICASCSLYNAICINDVLQEDIFLNTTYSNVEIEIIVKYCFHKLIEIRYLPSSGFKFWIKFTTNYGVGTNEEMARLPNEGTMKKKAITTTKNKVMNMLDKFFQIRGRTSTDLDVIEVAKEELILFLERR